MMYPLVLDLAADGVPVTGDLPGPGILHPGVLQMAQSTCITARLG